MSSSDDDDDDDGTTTTTTTGGYLGRDSSSPASRRQASFSLAFFDGAGGRKNVQKWKSTAVPLRCPAVSSLYSRERGRTYFVQIVS